MEWSRLDLGVGLVALAGTDLFWDDIADLVGVVEVEPQTTWQALPGGGWAIDPAASAFFKAVDRPVLSHGVGFAVGGTVAPDPEGVRCAAESARHLGAVHWSEHLSVQRANIHGAQVEAGFLLPPVPARATVRAAVDNIADYQRHLDLPFLVETPANYLRPRPGDLSDGELVAEVCEGADCGILLDLHNIWANERNGRQPVRDFLDEIPLERVWEVHLAGGFELRGYYLDAHCGPVAPELLALAKHVVPLLPNVRAIVFEAVPESLVDMGCVCLRDVLGQLRGVARLPAVRRSRRADAGRGVPAPRGQADRPQLTDGVMESAGVRAWPLGSPENAPGHGSDRSQAEMEDQGRAEVAERERTLLAYTTRRSDDIPGDDPGADILRDLTDHARLGLVAASRPELLAWMLTTLGRRETDRLLVDYLTTCPPQGWASEEGAAFASWSKASRSRWPLASPSRPANRSRVPAKGPGNNH
jgi:uncharacterized protein